MPKRQNHQLRIEISLGCLLFLLCVWASTLRLAAQSPAEDSQPATNAIYLPMVSRGANAPSVPTLTATPTMPTMMTPLYLSAPVTFHFARV